MKIAFFVEGLTESIFVKQLLYNYIEPNMSVKSAKLFGNNVLIDFYIEENNYSHQCLIIDCGSDESVLTRLKENYPEMKRKGWEIFFGLRDLKSEQYERYGESIVNTARQHISSFDVGNSIFFHFSKMEIEAWFLAEYTVFEKINESLTVDKITEITSKDLISIDPETDINNPASFINKIYKNVIGKKYTKKKYQIEEIVFNLDWTYICLEVREEGKISFFFDFLDDLKKTFF